MPTHQLSKSSFTKKNYPFHLFVYVLHTGCPWHPINPIINVDFVPYFLEKRPINPMIYVEVLSYDCFTNPFPACQLIDSLTRKFSPLAVRHTYVIYISGSYLSLSRHPSG